MPGPGEPGGPALAPRPCRVVGRRRETRDTVTIQVEPPGPGWLPGQFNMLYAFGVGEVPISISGGPARAGRLFHTVREVGLATAALCRLRPGDWAGVRGPFGSAWPLGEATGRDVVVVAGGLGMAPLRPAVRSLLRRPRAARRVSLVYGARTPADLLFRAELERLPARAGLDLHLTVDAAAPGWGGDVGVAAAELRRVAFDPGRALALVCGPEVMMRFTVAELRRLGVPDDRIWLSMERSMHCAVGLCGHCQLGSTFVCRDGPVLRLDAVAPLLWVREA